ncbi:class I SAM-dependent methyltransferase [Archangium primigenium]|uniref:class I SAM-dependent methyltransferase n=1 Tax=[Archangium] primigenium TaxID=2792470 RepID=UPI00195AEA7E|nr:class I SAM-dependent methyltransferase [Archangium primigenium]MBM7112119.1 class I SAM-dependent methyltransferase [Archangium primigenium]
MKPGEPSETALWMAHARAAHQVIDAAPHVLEDPIAPRLLTERQRAELTEQDSATTFRSSRPIRAFGVARSRYTEEALARAVAAGVRQYVVLGAGLDTFAYRNPFPHLRVFEVDHPATQAWKRERLGAAGIALPDTVTYAPVDFESHPLAEGLAAVGFAPDAPAFFSWLGVVIYLPRESFQSTLGYIAARPPGSGVCLDYLTTREEMRPVQQRSLDAVTQQVDRIGEPLRLMFPRAEMAAELTRRGLTDLEDLNGEDLRARYFAQRTDGLDPSVSVGRLVSAWIRAR